MKYQKYYILLFFISTFSWAHPAKLSQHSLSSMKQTQEWVKASLDSQINSSDNNLTKNSAITPMVTLNENPKKHRKIIVVIDPGHGGKDPGTTGVLGIKEKNVVLAISLDLYRILKRDPRFQPDLTRNGDYFVTLRGRLRIARQDHGDMFVAIHADAYRDSTATGAAIFALSAHGASSEAARWLAEKENYSELGDVSLNKLDDKSNVLRKVLIDLSQTATISASLQLGDSMIQQLANIETLHYHHVEQAPFMVLKSPDIPSLLVETGFLSNPAEETRLSNPAFQEKIANALYLGIKNYYRDRTQA
jgi:N-acetylmuramoyl-L-alanine amidase